MLKNKCIIFIMLLFALLSIGIASAEDTSSLELTDTDMTVSTTLMNDTGTEAIASEYEEETSLDQASKDDSSGIQPQTNDDLNENTLGAKSSNNDKTTFSENNLTNYNNELILNDKTLVASTNEASGSFTDLNNLITSTASGATLKLNSNYKMTSEESASFADGITISEDISINGNGFTIDANQLGRIFIIYSSATFTLANVTLANGKTDDYGGAIYNEGAGLTVSGCSFVNNSAEYGGAIYNYKVSDLSVSGCSFVNNSAKYGGAIYNYEVSDLSVSGCSFVNNSADDGGAIYADSGSCIVSGCSFVNNSADDGGAIYADSGSCIVSGCGFVNNSASIDGGAIYVFSGSCIVSGCGFVNNSAECAGGAIYSSESCSANDNWWGTNDPVWDDLVTADVTHDSYAVLTLTATSNNVAINFNRNTDNTVLPISRNVTLAIGADNVTTQEIVNGTFKTPYNAPAGEYNITATVDNQKLSANFIKYIYVDPVKGNDDNNNGTSWEKAVKTISKAMSLVSENGYNIYLADGTHSVDSSITIDKTVAIVGNGTRTVITNNKNGLGVFFIPSSVSNVAIYNCSFVNNSVTGRGGGAIYCEGSGLVVSGCSFVNNSASSSGGAIMNGWGNVAIYNCSFVNNSASRYGGGAIYCEGSGLVVSGCSFVNNSAYKYGGAINSGGSASGCVFVNNSVKYEYGGGGAIYGRCSASGCVFVNNSAPCFGDAVYDGSTIDDNWWGTNKPDFNKLLFGPNCYSYAVLNLTATSNNVDINFYRNGTTTVLPISRDLSLTINGVTTTEKIVNGTFKTNYTPVKRVYDIVASVDNQTLTVTVNNAYVDYKNGNDESNTGASWSSPFKTIKHAMDMIQANGTIYLADGTHEVSSLITIDKTVAIVGNGTKTLITNNKNGQGVFKITASDVAIYNCSFVNNSAEYYGGAISNTGSSLTVSGCSFVGNSAGSGGGAIDNDGSGLTVSGCSFVGNSAEVYGGTIYNGKNVGLTVSGCSFVNNSASYFGVIYNYGTLSLNNNTYLGISEGKTYIYNVGTLSSVNITVLDNKTVKAHPGETVKLLATVTCDGASVACGTLKFLIDDTEYDATSNDDGTYTCEYSVTYFDGSKVVSASYAKATEVSVENATLKYSIETFTELIKAMEYTNSILLTSDVIMAANETFADGITINKDIAINGNGFTIDANNYGRIFNITSDSLTLNNVTLANGKTTADGGAIYNKADLTLNNVTLKDNTAEKGVAIYNIGDLSLNNTKYSGITGDKTYIYNDGTLSSATITVLENKTINKYYGDAIKLLATVTSDGASVAGGTLKFFIGGAEVGSATSNSDGTYTLDYTLNFSGEKIVGATYDADEITVNPAILNVSKINPKMNITAENITFGEDLTVTIQLPEDITGDVTISVDGATSETITGASKTITDLATGSHIIIVKYTGNEKYSNAEVIKSVNVAKATPTLDVAIADINYGDKFTIKANLTGVNNIALANVIVEINNKKHVVEIKDGKGETTVTDKLPADKYPFTASWDGNDNYTATTSKGNFSVKQINPTVSINTANINVGDNETITVKLNNDATGKVTVSGTGITTQTVNVENGVATITIANPKADNYTISVSYSGDNNYAGYENNTVKFTVSKNKYDDYLIFGNITYGMNQTMIVTLPSDATGSVSLTIGETTYSKEVKNGSASITTPVLDAKQYKFTVDYTGDDKYVSDHHDGEFEVFKANAALNVIIDDVDYGKTLNIIATLTGINNIGLNGTVAVNINNKISYVNVTNGKGICSDLKLDAGEYKFQASWEGTNYNTAKDNGTFKVYTIYPTLDVTVSNINVGENEIIKFNLPDDAEGNITIQIGEKIYEASVRDGSKTISDLPEGNYIAIVTYTGDNNYNQVTVNKNFNVSKINPEKDIKFITENITVGSDENMEIIVPGATGSVIIYVDGEKYDTRYLDNGEANATITGLSVGDHSISIEYSGDSKYTGATVTKTINVAKANPTLSISISDVKYGEIFQITTSLYGLHNTPLNGTVYVLIDNRLYNITVVNGKATTNGIKLASGNYSATAYWDGNDNYTKVNDTVEFNVAKISTNLDIFVDNIAVGDDAVIEFVLPEDATGNVTITVDNKTYSVAAKEGLKIIFDLKAGNYRVNITYPGDNNYNSTSGNYTFSVYKLYPLMKIAIEDIVFGENGTLWIYNLPEDATGNVTIIVDDEEYATVDIEDGKANKTITGLSAGNYRISVTYNGDNKYETSFAFDNINVAKADADLNINIKNVIYGEIFTIDATLTGVNKALLNGTVMVRVNGKDYKVNVTNGKGTIDGTILKAGDHEFTATWTDNDNYNIAIDIGSFNVAKADSKLNVNIENLTYNNKFIINAELTGVNNAKLNGTVTVNVNGKDYEVTVINGAGTAEGISLNAGDYYFTAKWNGNTNYTGYETNGSFNVDKAYAKLDVDIEDVDYGEAFIIKANLTGIENTPLDGFITVVVNGEKYPVCIENGIGIATGVKLPARNYTCSANWEGNSNYYGEVVIELLFKVAKVTPSISITTEDIYVDEDETIEFTLPDDATGNVTIKIGNDSYIVPVEDGKKVISNLSQGNYTVIVTYDGDNNYNPVDINDTFWVFKVFDYDMDITIPTGVKFGEEPTITVELPIDATGNVTFTVDGETYNATVEKGTATLSIPQLSVGLHNITTTYAGDNKYDPMTKKGSITILPNDVILTADNVVMLYHDGTRLVAKLTDKFDNPIANTPIFFTLNGIIYNRTTDENGTASMALNLDYGNYTATVTYFGNSSYNAATTNANITITPSIIGHDIVKMYQNDTQFNATFLDNYGNPLVNTTVKFNINGVFYERNTTENGVAKLNINLRPGNYTLTAYNPITGEQQGFNVLVKTLIIASDLTKYYNNGSSFKATIYNKNGTLAVNKSVTFNINGVFYERNTTENGTVDLAITLRPGDYIITTTVDGLEVSNNIKVLPTLITKDLTMNYHDGSTFNATVLDGQGNPLVNQTVQFNVHGKFYSKITGNDGVASLNINLNKGQYIITSMWNKYQVGNNITIY